MADDPKLAEFRDRNVALMKEIDDLKAKYKDIDPDAVAADRLKLTEFEAAKAQLDAARVELTTAKAALAEAQATADASTLQSVVSDKFIKAGGRANATDFIIAKAKALFSVEGGELVGKVFDPNRPGEKLTVDGFIALQVKEADFAFLPSQGGGATKSRPGGATSGAKELRNPTAQQLGAHGDAIRRGDMRVVYDNE